MIALSVLRKPAEIGQQGLTPIILATGEAEIRIVVQGQHGQII
jgi:hypothetical protein